MAYTLPNQMPTGSKPLMQGMDLGNTMYARAMQSILDREHQKQAQDQFKQQMDLRKQQFARSGANADLQRQLLQQQLLGLKNKNDPMYEMNQFTALQNMLTGGGQTPGQAAPPMPTQEMGEGMGMFTPEGMQQVQAAPPQDLSQGAQGGGINLEAMRNNPMLRGFFKHKFGIDPLAAVAQTPEDKQAMALDLFKQKEELKKQNKGGAIPTTAVMTQNQQALQGIDTVIPLLDDLILNPKQIFGPTDFSPSKKATYNAKTSAMIDTLVAAQSLPKVQASIDLVEQQIRRATNESTDSYIKRIKDLRKDLTRRRDKAVSVVKNKSLNTQTSNDISNMSDDELRKIIAGGV